MSQSNKKTPIEHYSNPLDTIIDFAWSAGADRFWVNNAKDELKKLRQKIKEHEDNGHFKIYKKLAE
jgi:hypothetical protein